MKSLFLAASLLEEALIPENYLIVASVLICSV